MNHSLYINFGTAVLTFVFGLLLVTGIIYPGNIDNTKLMFGLVLMIYGVYRFITSITKVKQARLEAKRQELNEEKERLLKKL